MKFRLLSDPATGQPYMFPQGYRSDWVYADDYATWEASDPIAQPSLQMYMIWPWVLDEDGVAYDEGAYIQYGGFADMRICVDEMRPIHRRKIRIGVKGYWVRGAQRIAEAEVVDILYLNHDFGKLK